MKSKVIGNARIINGGIVETLSPTRISFFDVTILDLNEHAYIDREAIRQIVRTSKHTVILWGEVFPPICASLLRSSKVHCRWWVGRHPHYVEYKTQSFLSVTRDKPDGIGIVPPLLDIEKNIIKEFTKKGDRVLVISPNSVNCIVGKDRRFTIIEPDTNKCKQLVKDLNGKAK